MPSSTLIALVPAAGGSQRFGGPRPKQYMPLAGRTVLECTLWRLHQGLKPDRIVVVLAPDDKIFPTLTDVPPGIEALHCGGVTRAESVRNGLLALARQCSDRDWIAVHDAARPCVPIACLQSLATAAREATAGENGALLAVPLTDTLKEGTSGGIVTRAVTTLDRARFWGAQTPQMFRYGILCKALSQEGALSCTDESQAVERYCKQTSGTLPLLLRGSAQNLKLTYAEDLLLAEAILAFQKDRSS
ncbi:MAG: 2-C-methyl-D-erythritol 4-phosphate cytidylyltransferase [Proteobacteria bacterium]|nr:2-C-methyl-D-erythritol 4-phosphate cytidylyltransferase [Pseudomonadota bacterium]MCL2308475.1 2-C-methyl-D-erythritol 4-phosphate cytidylyltransferase [Pseudomonadota bacterium]